MAKKYPWPTWVLYNRSFCKESTWMPDQQWGKENSSLYARYFNGTPAESTEVHGRNCQMLEHSAAATCTHRSLQKKARQDDLKPVWDQPCKKYNYNDGRCSFGSSCQLPHKCLACSGAHPIIWCHWLQSNYGGNKKKRSKKAL